MVDVKLTVEGGSDVALRLAEGEGMTLTLGMPYVDGGGVPYEGDYNIRPQPREDQVLPTAHRRMDGDITVQRIPYFETTNVSGGWTAVIGD